MGTYIILTKIAPDSFSEPKDFKKVAARVSDKIKNECPKVVWRESFSTLGRFDVVDIVESDDLKQLEKAVMIIRGYGHATTETLVARPWREFLNSLE